MSESSIHDVKIDHPRDDTALLLRRHALSRPVVANLLPPAGPSAAAHLLSAGVGRSAWPAAANACLQDS